MPKTLKPQPSMSPVAEAYAATALQLSRDVQSRQRVVLDVPYGPDDEQQIDLYLSDNATSEPVPVLLFMHGGGWRHGYKEWMGFMAPAITCLPAIFISVGYRLAPNAKYPAPLEDCWNALRWVHENIGRYGGDPDRLMVGGHSAGGHLAAMLALQRNVPRDYGLPEAVVKGCFPVSGVFDLTDEPSDGVKALLSSPDDGAAASPIRLVADNRVPFFIAIGEHDSPRLVEQYEVMGSALRSEAGPVSIMKMDGCDHFQANIQGGEINGVWATEVRRWMADPTGAKG